MLIDISISVTFDGYTTCYKPIHLMLALQF